MGEIPILIAIIATFIQWVRDDSREAKRLDRASDRAVAMGDDDELAKYNQYLAKLADREKKFPND
jgi:cytochrome c oxidase assembly factor CtaG